MSHIVVGTAGHIDHGKSSLVQALTGIDPDRLKEEKERGITIELGFAHMTIGDLTVAFVDVPGHERFVRTMLAGVGGLDCVLLIVAADESVMPQTREHFDICRLLRVEHGVIVLTKIDVADDDMIELARLEVRDLVEGSFLQNAPVLTVSSQTGDGLDGLRDALAGVASRVSHRSSDGATRLAVDRVFSMQGFGTVVTGTLVSGGIRVDDELVLVPGDQRVRVRGVQVHGRKREMAVAGQRTAVNLGGIELAQVHRGQTLASPGTLTMTRRVDASLELLSSTKPLRHGARVRVHHGTAEILGRLSVAGTSTSDVQPGSETPVRIRLEQPAALTRGDRFIVRTYSPALTIGGGQVLDPDPARVGVRTTTSPSRFAALARDRVAPDDLQALTRMVQDTGAMGLGLAALVSRGGVAPGRVADVAGALCRSSRSIAAGDRLVARASVETLSGRLLNAVAEFHKAQPLVDGMPRQEARERIFARAHPHVFDLVLTDLAASGRLVVRDRLALPSHRLALSPEEERARTLVETSYGQAGLKPPDAATLAADNRLAPALVEKMTALLLRQKVLVRVDTLVFHADALAGLVSDVQGLKKGAAGGRATVDVATFKVRYGVSRKFAIPLLEWLDRERITKRVGETRAVL